MSTDVTLNGATLGGGAKSEKTAAARAETSPVSTMGFGPRSFAALTDGAGCLAPGVARSREAGRMMLHSVEIAVVAEDGGRGSLGCVTCNEVSGSTLKDGASC